MATKQNMYVGAANDILEINNKINDAVFAWKKTTNGREIIAYEIDKALNIRDDVAELKGELKILIKGLDDGSKELAKYQGALDHCNHFLDSTRKELENGFKQS